MVARPLELRKGFGMRRIGVIVFLTGLALTIGGAALASPPPRAVRAMIAKAAQSLNR